jgi:hypothetical protein
MLIGALLFLTWLILLIRYPGKALPVSLAALAGLGAMALWVIWQDHRQAQRLSQLQLSLAHDPQTCPAERSLAVRLHNGSDRPVRQLRWKVSAYAPGVSANLVQSGYAAEAFHGPDVLLPGAHWQRCQPVPTLRPGYRASTLEFRAEALHGEFAD